MLLQGDQLSRMTIRGFKSIKNCDISFGKINEIGRASCRERV